MLDSDKLGTKHFATKTGYLKWLAHGHIHGEFEKVSGSQKIFIGGKPHKVKHMK